MMAELVSSLGICTYLWDLQGAVCFALRVLSLSCCALARRPHGCNTSVALLLLLLLLSLVAAQASGGFTFVWVGTGRLYTNLLDVHHFLSAASR